MEKTKLNQNIGRHWSARLKRGFRKCLQQGMMKGQRRTLLVRRFSILHVGFSPLLLLFYLRRKGRDGCFLLRFR
jgi:hypothetical protein